MHGLQDGYIELFDNAETVIDMEFSIIFPMKTNISADDAVLFDNITRNGTIYVLDTRELNNDINNITIFSKNRFEAISSQFKVYKLDFDIVDLPSKITRSANLTLNYARGFSSFALYVSTDRDNWSYYSEISETFELNVTDYTNTTLYLRVVGFSENGNQYNKTYGPYKSLIIFMWPLELMKESSRSLLNSLKALASCMWI